MRVLLFGADGQVGHELRGPLASFAEVVAKGRGAVDLASPEAVRAAIREASPDAIVNAASYNDVDGAERDEAGARAVNELAVLAMGEEAKARRIALLHYSTDFVFDGTKPEAYVEADTPNPLGAYGRSKRAGEERLAAIEAPAIVLRTAWVYGLRRKSFVSAILRAAREKERLEVVADQVGNPTFCRDLAVATALLLHGVQKDPHGAFAEARGVYHLAGEGAVSRHALAVAALELDPRKASHRVREVVPVASDRWPSPAKRPARAELDCSAMRARFGITLPPWREALVRALAKRLVDE